MRWTLGVLCLGLVACGTSRVEDAPADALRAASTPLPAKPAPDGEDLQLTDADTLLASLDQQKRGLVVNMWASWCGSCKEEIPILLELRKQFTAEGIEFAFVSADEPQAFPEAVKLMREWQGPLPVIGVRGKMSVFARSLSPEWHGGIPATFLFDATRKLRHVWEGPILQHEIAPILQGLLAGEPIDGVTRTAASRPN